MNKIVKFIDVSHWRSYVPWQDFLDNGWISAYIKADASTERHFNEARAAGYQRLGIYLWHDPTLSVERNISKGIEYVERFKPEYLVVDIEHWWKSWSQWSAAHAGTIGWSDVGRFSGQQISDHAKAVVEGITPLVKQPVWNYSAAWFINGYAPQLSSWIGDYPYINADYSSVPDAYMHKSWGELNTIAESVGRSNYMPKGIPVETARQFASKFFPNGHDDHYDMNVFFGDLDEFDQAIGLVPTSDDDEEEAPIRWVGQVTAYYLNVRLGPSTNYKAVPEEYLIKDERVEILDEEYGWGKIAENRWISLDWVKKVSPIKKPVWRIFFPFIKK